MTRWNHNNYLTSISIKYNKKFEVLENFINLNTQILHKCLQDNYIFNAKPKNIIKSGYCKECNRRNREEKFKKKLEQKHPHITLIEDYKTAKISRYFCCSKHNKNFVFKKVPMSVLNSKEPCDLCRKDEKLKNERKSLKSTLKKILNIKDNKSSNCKYKEIKDDNLEKVALDEETTIFKKLKKKINHLF